MISRLCIVGLFCEIENNRKLIDSFLKVLNLRCFFVDLKPTEAYFIYTVLQCDLPPLRPHCGEAPGGDSNPELAI